MNHIDTMKLALKALKDGCILLENYTREGYEGEFDDAISALLEALAEHPAQGCEYCNHPLYAGTKCKNCGRVTEQAAIKRDLTPEQPAQRKPWVGLTPEQRATIAEANNMLVDDDLFDAIEAELKEKNA